MLPPDGSLEYVGHYRQKLLNARLVTVLLPAGATELRFVAVAGEGASELIGKTTPRVASKSGRVIERGRSERVDSVLDDPEVDHEVMRHLGARTGLWVPLVARGRTIGLLAAHDKLVPDARFTDNDLRLAETFEELRQTLIKQKITTSDQTKLVDTFITDVGGKAGAAREPS